MKKITIAGAGYVGFSLAILLAEKNEVKIFDIDEEKVNLINKKEPPIQDKDIDRFIKEKKLNLIATSDQKLAFEGADFTIIATPTDYDEKTNYFNTDSVKACIENSLKYSEESNIIIKSTVPVGYTQKLADDYGLRNLLFSPEFLREGKALHDNLYPSRIVVGGNSAIAKDFASLLIESCEKKSSDVPVLITNTTEAEAIKLFSNTYLAMRVSFFNELDSFALLKNLDSEQIINGVCLDYRIGQDYNNPGFGYGGYCLPKDTKQLLANYEDVPNSIISAIVEANKVRKDFIAESIIKLNPKKVGIYKLIMKKGSDNIRESAVQGIMKRVKSKGIEVVVFEPMLKEKTFFNSKVFNNFEEFKKNCDLIVANRMSKELLDVSHKLFTRDIYQKD